VADTTCTKFAGEGGITGLACAPNPHRLSYVSEYRSLLLNLSAVVAPDFDFNRLPATGVHASSVGVRRIERLIKL